MPLPALLGSPAPDLMAAALCAAELNEPFDLEHTPSALLSELFRETARLRGLVPCATFRLLARLANDRRDELRAGTARALAEFVQLYPTRVEELLLPLACDSSRRVRAAAAETLAALLEHLPDREPLLERWRRHPDRALDVLERASRLLVKKP
jgi:hypothetical protein